MCDKAKKRVKIWRVRKGGSDSVKVQRKRERVERLGGRKVRRKIKVECKKRSGK